jgi:hypothetical protein
VVVMAVDSEPLSASNSLNEAEAAACTQITHPAHFQHSQSSFVQTSADCYNFKGRRGRRRRGF